MPPWEKYQSQQTPGPWAKYQKQEPAAIPAPQEQGFFEGVANVGSDAITRRGIGLMQTAQDFGIPVNQAFGITPEQFKSAAQAAVTKSAKTTEGAGTGAKIVGSFADPVNLSPLGRFGKLALPAYGAISGFTSGQEDDTGLGGRALDAVGEAALTTVGGKILEKGVKAAAPTVAKYTPKVVKTGINKIADALIPTAAGPTIKNAMQAPDVIPNAAAIKENSNLLYDEAKQYGASFSPKLGDEIAVRADANKAKGLRGVLKPEEKAFNEKLDYYKNAQGGKLTLEDVQAIDQQLNDDISAYNRSGYKDYARRLNDMKYHIRNLAKDPNYIIGSAKGIEAALAASNEWSRSLKMRDYEKIIENAKLADNPDTAIRTGLRNLLKNENKMRAYTKEEKSALKKGATMGIGVGAAKLTSNKALDAFLGAITGFAGGGVPGSIAGAVAGRTAASASSSIAGRMQANRAKIVAKEIAKSKGGIKKANLPTATSEPTKLLTYNPKVDDTLIVTPSGEVSPITKDIALVGESARREAFVTGQYPRGGKGENVIPARQAARQRSMMEQNLKNIEAQKALESRAASFGIPNSYWGGAPLENPAPIIATTKKTLPYQDWNKLAQKNKNIASAKGKPIKNTDMADNLAAALNNIKKGKNK